MSRFLEYLEELRDISDKGKRLPKASAIREQLELLQSRGDVADGEQAIFNSLRDILTSKKQNNSDKIDETLRMIDGCLPRAIEIVNEFAVVPEVADEWMRQAFFYPFTHTDPPVLDENDWAHAINVLRDVRDLAQHVVKLRDSVLEGKVKYYGAQSDQWKRLVREERFNICLWQIVDAIKRGRNFFYERNPTAEQGWFPSFLWREAERKWKYVHELNIVSYIRQKEVSERESLLTSFVARNIARKFVKNDKYFKYPSCLELPLGKVGKSWELHLFRHALNCLKHSETHKKSIGGVWSMLVVHLGFMFQWCLSNEERKRFDVAPQGERVSLLDNSGRWKILWRGKWHLVSDASKVLVASWMRFPLFESKIFIVPVLAFAKHEKITIQSSELRFHSRLCEVSDEDLQMICYFVFGWFDMKIPIP